MSKSRSVILSTAIIVLLAGIVVGQIGFGKIPMTGQVVASTHQAGSLPKIAIGPYVQNVTPTSAVIMWESSVPSFAELKVTGHGVDEHRRTGHAVKQGEIRVNGLKPDTQYNYVLTLSSNPGSTAADTFKTFPTRPGPIKFLVYGDTRTNPNRHREVIHAMANEQNVEFALHTGDLVENGDKLELWEREFFGPAHELMSRVPVYAVLGNHERNSPNYFQFLSLPGNERYYSFDLPNVHIIALDSYSDFDKGSEQYKWLLNDLIKHKNVKWKFVFLHVPVYDSGPHGAVNKLGIPKEKPMAVARRLMPQLAATYGITAVFSGHDHDYERSTRDGVYYIVSGGGGAPAYSDVNASANPYRNVFYSLIHYCVVTIDGDKGEIIAKTPQGRVLDRVKLQAR